MTRPIHIYGLTDSQGQEMTHLLAAGCSVYCVDE
jgi:hypothetical protein